MPTDPRTNARYPASNYAPAIHQYIQEAVTDLSGVSIPRFSSNSERDTDYAATGGTSDGMVCAVGGRLQTRRNSAWRDVAPTLSRFLTLSGIGGTLGSGVSADLVSSQTVAANPFGIGVAHRVEMDARVRLTIPAGLGAKLELRQDGVLMGGEEFTNGGSTCTITLSCRDIAYVSDGLSHVYRAVLTALAGTITVHSTAGDYGRVFLETRPYETLP